MQIPKSFAPALDVEDLKNGGNQKVVDAIKVGVDLRTAKKVARELRRLNLRRTDFDYLKQALMPLLNGYHIGSVASNTDEPIYRAVPWETKPTLLEHLGCAPPAKVVQGRANRPNSPMFYGSAGCHSTIMELAPNLETV